MKYILCEEQDFEDLTRYVIECDDIIIVQLQKYLDRSGAFGEVIAVLDCLPLAFDELVVSDKWLWKELKMKKKLVKENQKEWNKAKGLTQKMLDEQYKRQEATHNAMVAGFGGNVTFAAPMYTLEKVEEVQREARSLLRKSKKLLSMLIDLTINAKRSKTP